MPDLHDLPITLERWGLTVVPVTGWQDRKRPGAFAPIGVLIHHTAAPDRTKDAPSLQVCIDGRADLPGPLCQLLVARSGKVYVISRGRCNHAGEGGLNNAAGIGTSEGNALLLGVEAENDGVGEPWPAVQVGAMVRCSAAVLDLLGQSRRQVWGHKEYAPLRKIDPAGIDMTQFRAMVAAARPNGAPMPTDPVKASQQRLNDSGVKPPLVIDGVWGPVCDAALDAVLHYQQGQMADLKAANATSADTIKRVTAERDSWRIAAEQNHAEVLKLADVLDDARDKREAAEAEVTKLRAELQTGGRLTTIVADINIARDHLDAAVAKARA